MKRFITMHVKTISLIWLAYLVGKALVYLVGGLGSIPSWTNTQGLKTTEEKVLSNICKWLDFCIFLDKNIKP